MVTAPATLDLISLLPRIEQTLFAAEDSISLERAELALAATRATRGLPVPLRRAAILEQVFAGMTLDCSSNPVFAGCTAERPRAWMLVPECGFGVSGQAQIEHDQFSPAWHDARIPAALRAAWQEEGQYGCLGGLGHLTVDYALVVERGLAAVIDELAAAEDGDPARDLYRRAMRRSCQAVIAWAGRWAEAAEAAAQETADPLLAACHRRVADACRQVPAHPARDLFEGLQSMLLLHLALVLEGQGYSLSPGAPDRALARFADEAAAAPEEAVQLIRAFLIAIAATSWQGRHSKTQAITLGGARADGSDACNALTLAFLNAYRRTPVADPHCFLRWHAGIDERVWSTTVELLSAGRSMPLLFNDHEVVPHLVASGIPAVDAWEYCAIGCNEIGIPGRLCASAFPAGFAYNELELLDRCLRAGPATDADGLLRGMRERLEAELDQGYRARVAQLARLVRELPMPLASACCAGSATAGADLLASMPYDLPGCYLRGTANAINALAALDSLVWRGGMAPSDFLARLDARDPELLALIAAAPKWCDDDERADRWADRLAELRRAVLAAVCARHGLRAVALCHVVRSLHHLDGRRIGNTADGRAAGTPVGDSIGPVCGTTHEGPTAQLCSVLRIPGRDFLGVYNHNLTLSGSQAGPAVLRPLIEGFFADGGQELQINVLDAARLRAARSDPAAFGDLVVRIAGLNARFIELSRLEQDEIIRRAEMAAEQDVPVPYASLPGLVGPDRRR